MSFEERRLRDLANELRTTLHTSGRQAKTENIMAAIFQARGRHSRREAVAAVPGSSGRGCEVVMARLSALVGSGRSPFAEIKPVDVSELERLRRVVSSYSVRLRDVPGDGNCQLHAVLHQLRLCTAKGNTFVATRLSHIEAAVADGLRDVDVLRSALLEQLRDEDLLQRWWFNGNDTQAQQVEQMPLKQTLQVCVLAFARVLHAQNECMCRRE